MPLHKSPSRLPGVFSPLDPDADSCLSQEHRSYDKSAFHSCSLYIRLYPLNDTESRYLQLDLHTHHTSTIMRYSLGLLGLAALGAAASDVVDLTKDKFDGFVQENDLALIECVSPRLSQV